MGKIMILITSILRFEEKRICCKTLSLTHVLMSEDTGKFPTLILKTAVAFFAETVTELLRLNYTESW